MLERDHVGGSWDFTPLLKPLVHNCKVTADVAHLYRPTEKGEQKRAVVYVGAPWTEVYVGAPWTGCSMDCGTCKHFLAIAIIILLHGVDHLQAQMVCELCTQLKFEW